MLCMLTLAEAGHVACYVHTFTHNMRRTCHPISLPLGLACLCSQGLHQVTTVVAVARLQVIWVVYALHLLFSSPPAVVACGTARHCLV